MGKYEEALERAKELHESGNALTKLQMEIVFPVLKESKDESIRKYIQHELACLRASEGKGSERYNELSSAIDYLERQKEQKPVEGTALQKAFVNSKKDYTLEEKCDASDYADTILPTGVTYGENDEEYKLHKIIEAAFIAGKKTAQKPAEWSEEDEFFRQQLIVYCESCVQDSLAAKCVDWLKSLRSRPKSSDNWKPSEEQMSALKHFIGPSVNGAIVAELYDDLKNYFSL